MNSLLEKNLISTKEASEFSGYNADYLSRLCRSEKIEGMRIGRSWLVSQESLEAFMKEQGARKQELRDQLSETREKEYQHHTGVSQTPFRASIRRTVHKLSPAFLARVSIQAKHLTTLEKPSDFQKQGIAAIAAMVVLIFGVYVAQAAPGNFVVQDTAATALGISDGIRTITFNAVTATHANAAKTIALATENASRANTMVASPLLAPLPFSLPTISGITATSSVKTSTGDHGKHTSRAATSRKTAKIAMVTKTKKSQLAKNAATRNIAVVDVAENLANLEIGAMISPRRAAVALAAAEVHGYVAVGAGVYDSITGGMSSYASGVTSAGNVALALGTGIRDTSTNLPIALALNETQAVFAWVHFSDQILHTYSDGVYAWVNETPVIPARIVAGEYQTGEKLAEGTAVLPQIAISSFQNGMNGWVNGTQNIPHNVALAELTTAGRVLNTSQYAVNTVFSGEMHVLTNVNVALASGAQGGASLAAAIIPLQKYSFGEQVAVATYTVLHGLFTNAQQELALILQPNQNTHNTHTTALQIVPTTSANFAAATSTHNTVVAIAASTNTSYTAPSLTTNSVPKSQSSVSPVIQNVIEQTIVQGVTQGYVDSAISNLQGLFQKQIEASMRSVDQNGGYSGTNTVTVSQPTTGALSGTALNVSGDTNINTLTAATTTINGSTIINGNVTITGTLTAGNFTGGNNSYTVSSGNAAPNFVATSTTATSTFAGSVDIDNEGLTYATTTRTTTIQNAAITNSTSTNATSTNFFASNAFFTNASITAANLGNASSTNFFASLLQSTTGIFATISAQIANFTGLTSVNATSTNATSTNLYATNSIFGNLLATIANFTSAIITNLTATNAVFTNATSTNATSTNFFASNGTFTNASITNASLTNATSTNFAVTNLTSNNINAATGSINALTVAGNSALANVTFTNATGTSENLATLTTSGTTTVGGLSIGNLNGFLKATAGAISTSLITLTSDVTGILPIQNGGTGTSSFATNGVVYGNSTSSLLTTAQGGANTVLVANNGAPSFSSAITVGTSVTTPTLNATNALEINGANINTAGTLSNVAYNNQSNSFSGTQSFANYSATNGSTTNATSTNLSTTNLTATNFTLGSLSGILKAVNGVVTTAIAGTDYENPLTFSTGLQRIANTITNTGVLSISNANNSLTVSTTTGTVSVSLNTGNINTFTALQQFNGNASTTQLTVSGNSYLTNVNTSGTETAGNIIDNALATNALVYANGSDQVTSATVAAPLSFNSGTLAISQAGTSTSGYLSSSDWNIFNNKISSTSLSSGAGISYNASTGVIANTGVVSFNGRTGVVAPASGDYTTSQVTEGSNLYFTNARADARINATSTIATLISAPSLATISTNLTGILRTTSGVLSTGAINLASADVTGTLAVANGGTGSTTLTGILKGNGTGGIQTAIAGTDYLTPSGSGASLTGITTTQVAEGTNLYFTNARAQAAISVAGLPLTYTSGVIGINQASGSQSGYLSATDWNTFNNKISSSSLSATTPLAYNSSTGNFSLGTVGITNGGTGITSYSPGDVLYANGSGVLVTLPIGTDGQVLKIAGGVPGWGVDETSGGGGSDGVFATSSNIIYPINTSNALILGSNAQSDSSSLFEVHGVSYFSSNVGIGTTSPGSLLSVGNTNGINFTTGTSTFETTGGINIANGCFAVNGTCVTGAGVAAAAGTLTGTTLASNVVSSSLTSVGTLVSLAVSGQTMLGNASTTALTASGAANVGSLTVGTLNGILYGTNGAVATATISSPLSFSAGTLAISQAGTATSGYLSATDWNTFNNKISSSSLSAATPLAYNSSTGVFSLGTVNVANGGTGSTTLTGILKGNGTGGIQTAIAGTDYLTPSGSGASLTGITTTQVAEGTNLYFTNARAIAATLTGYTSGAGTISSSDSVLSAIQKLNGNIGTLVTGVSSVSNSDGTLTISPTTGAVVASLNLAHANTFTALQQFNGNASTTQLTVSGNSYFTTVNTSGNETVTGTTTVGNLVVNNSSATSTFAGNIGVSGNIVPSASNTYALGSVSYPWKEVYIGPGSLYVNGQEVLSTDASQNVVVSSDVNENLELKTTGTANVLLNPAGSGQIQLSGPVQISGGQQFTTSNGSAVIFPSGTAAGNITVSGNSIAATNLNGGISITPSGNGGTYITTGNFGIGSTSPNEPLSVVGAAYITGGVGIGVIDTTNGTLQTSGNATIGGTLAVGSLNGLLKASSGVVSAATAGTDYLAPGSLSAGSGISYNSGTGVIANTGVVSFNGRTGAVVPSSGDYTTTQVAEGTNLYFTNARAQSAISVTGLPLTYTSGVIGINQANTSTTGYLSSTDWNTFNNKQAALAFTYPLLNSANVISLAFGTTTANAYSQLQQFNGGAVFTNATSTNLFTSNLTANTLAVGGTATTTTIASNGSLTAPSLTIGSLTGLLYGSSGTVGTVTVSAPLSFSAGTLAISQAGTATSGYLSATDWNTFNNKISSSSLSATAPLAYNSATGVFSLGTVNVANGGTGSTTLTGILKGNGTGGVQTAVPGVDYQPAGAYLTGNQSITLSGDVTGTGATSITTTLATVNSNTGSFGSSTAIPTFTVNGKGLITAAGTVAVVAPAGTLTGATLASNVLASSLTSVGTLSSLTVSGLSTLASANFSGNVALANATSTNFFGSTITSNTAAFGGTGTTTIASNGIITAPNIINNGLSTNTIVYANGSKQESSVNIGGGLTFSGGILSATGGVSTTSLATGFFYQGGNAFGAAAVLGTTDSNPLTFITGGNEVGRFTSTGYFGIDTTNPSYLLDIGSHGELAQFGDTSSNDYVSIAGGNAYLGYDSLFGNAVVQGTSGNGIEFNVNNSTFPLGISAILTSAGNFGVGTTSPGSKLAVSGTAYVSGTATLGNLIDSGISANSLPYINGSQQFAAATLPSYLTLTSGTLAISSLPNAQLANSTISGIALGSNLANLSATNSTLTFSGSYNGGTAQTIGLNLGNANTWTAAQTFNGGATLNAATSSSFAITGIASALLKANANGSVIPAVAGTDYLAPASLSATYPLQYSANNFTLAFGTTTSNTWAGTQTFTNTIVGSINGNASTVTTDANLTGDVTSVGNTTTLATVNANTGSFGSSTAIPTFTVNGKGLITAAGTVAVVAPAGTLTGATLASNVLASSLTSVGTLSSLNVSGLSALATLTATNATTTNIFAANLTANTASFGATASTTIASNGALTAQSIIDSAATANALLYSNGSKQDSSVTLPSYVTLTSGTLAISALPNAQLANSSLSVNAGSGLTGGGSVSLGGATSLAIDFTHNNIWSGFQIFNAATSTSLFSSSLSANTASFGATASTTIASNGALTTPSLTIGTLNGLLYGNSGAVTTATVSAPLTFSAGTLAISQANTSTNGYLSSTDWNTFNNKIASTSLSGGTGISYNSATGVIANTGVTSVAASGGTTGLTFSGSPVTTTGTLTLGGTLAVANGGTGITTPTAAGVLLGNYAGTGYQQIATSSLGILTTNVAEGTNLYFTNARAIAATLTGYTSGAGTISSSDSVLSAIQKLNGNIGALVTGVSSVSNSDGSLTISPTTGAVVASLNLGHTNTFTAEQNFNGNASVSSTNYILFNGASDTNWRMGYNTGAFTYSIVGTPLTIVTGTGSTDGFAVGGTGGQSFFEIKGSNNQAYFRGAVGIGTTTPGATLAVNGSGYFNGNLTAANLTATGTLAVAGTANITGTATLGNLIDSGISANSLPYVNGSQQFAAATLPSYLTLTSGTLAISNLPNAQLANSSVTVSAGTGLSGGGAVALGGTVTLTNAGVTSNVAGTGISVSGATGAVTITNTGVTSITGTPNQITASAATGALTLSLPSALSLTNATSTNLFASNLTSNTASFGSTASTTIAANGALTTPNLTVTTTLSLPSASVTNAELANSTISGVALGGTLGALTATNGTLTFSGSYNGGTAQTVALNLSNANTWTALQQFNGNASTTQFTSTGNTYLATAGGNVGIGTTTPVANLGLQGSIGVNATQLYLAANGSVGIGTNSNLAALSIQSTATSTAGLGSELTTDGTFATTPSAWTYSGSWSYTGSAMSYTGTTGPAATNQILLNYGGKGYVVNDVVTLTNGANDTTITVTSVSATGAITAFTVTSYGSADTVNTSVNTTGGTGSGANFSIAKLANSSATLSQTGLATNGNTYQVTYTITGYSGTGWLAVAIGGVTGQSVNANGTYTQNITATGSGALTFTPTADFTGTLTLASVKLITQTNSIASILNSSGTTGIEFRTGASGLNDLFIGNGAGKSDVSGGSDTALGYLALNANTTGSNNTAIGTSALQNNTIGSNNTAIGQIVLQNNTTGTQNTSVGNTSLANNTTGNTNTALGYRSLFSNTTGSGNVAIGTSALQNNTTASYNVALGNSALFSNTTGSGDTALGFQALINNTTGTVNIAVGQGALYSNTTGGYNTALGGYNTLYSNTTGTGNVAIGAGVMANNTTGGYNTAIGLYQTLTANTTGSNNIAIGQGALYSNTTGGTNIGIGLSALFNNTSATSSVALGYQAGYGVSGVSASQYNTFLGTQSGFGNTTGNNNALTGYQSGYNLSSGGNNTVNGYQALYNATSTGNEVAIGYQALYNDNAATGAASNENTAVGYSSLYQNTTGINNAAFGYLSLYHNTTGGFNTALGEFTLFNNTTGSNNSAFGLSALQFNTTGANNTAVGQQSLYYNASATSSVAIGYLAAQGTASYSNQGGTYIGYLSGYSAQTGSNYNTLLGYQSGYDITTGANNLVLGTEQTTGSGITTGSNNILIGNGVSAGLSQTGSNQLNIGNLIFGTSVGTGSTLSTGNVGIGSTGPNARLDIVDSSGNGPSTSGSAAIGGTRLEYGATALDMGVQANANPVYTWIQSRTNNNYAINTSLALNPNGGNVGIGTTTPGTTLAVNGNFSVGTSWIGNSTAWGFQVPNHGNAYGEAFVNAQGMQLGFYANPQATAQTGTLGIAYPAQSSGIITANSNLVLGANSVEALRVSGSNVGVGSTSPYANLSINANAGSTNTTLFAIGSSTASATTTLLTVDNQGNLTVGGAIVGPAASTLVIKTGNNQNLALQPQGGGGVGVYSSFNSYGNAYFGGTVGVGTTTPGATFAVNGSGYFNGNLTAANLTATGTLAVAGTSSLTGTLTLGKSNSTNGQIILSDAVSGNTASITGGSAGSLALTVGNNGLFTLTNGVGTQVVTVGNAGNFGIGTTSAYANLSVQNNYGSTNSVLFSIASSTAVGNGSASTLFSVDTAGNTTLAGALKVGSNISFITNNDSISAVGNLTLQAGNTATLSLNTLANGNLSFGPGGSTAGTWLANGNLGIGTTSPGSLLSVAGSGYFAGNLGIDQYSSFQQNGQTILEASTTQQSIYLGSGAGYNSIKTAAQSALYNIAIGANALYTATSSTGNIAIGANALYNTQSGSQAYYGLNNIGIGYLAGQTNTTGFDNSFVGPYAGQLNTTGAANAFFGYNVGRYNTTGSQNIAIGGRSDGTGTLYNNQAGSNNVAVGAGALNGSTGNSINANVGVGVGAGYQVTGGYNTFLGYQAGYDLTSGNTNIVIGQNVDAPSATGSSQLNIGNLIYGTGVYAGGTMSSAPILNTFVGIGSTTPYANLSINANAGSTNTTLFAIGSSTAAATTTLLTVTNAGSVGIGTVAGTLVGTANASLLAVGVADIGSGAGYPTVSIDNGSFNNAALTTRGRAFFNTNNTDYGAVVNIGNAGNLSEILLALQGEAGATGNLLQVASSSGAMFLNVTAGGNVGIGTSSPASPFSVQGNSYLNGNVGINTQAIFPGLTISGGSGVAGQFYVTGASGLPNIGFVGYNSSSQASLNWASGGNRTFSIYNSGNGGGNLVFGGTGTVGAGTGIMESAFGATSTPSSILGVAGYAGGTVPLFMLSSSTSGYATTTVAEIDQNGNALFGLGGASVGIGTTTPGATFAVNGAGYFSGALGVSGTATVGNLINNGVTASTLLYVNGSKQESSVSLPSYVTLTSGTLAISNLPNAQLQNSTISGVALGGTLGALTATNSTLTFSGSYTGAGAQTVGLNLGNANTWTALQQFNGNASTTQLTSTGNTYLATAGGSVGVGTASPISSLDVVAPSASQMTLGSATGVGFALTNSSNVFGLYAGVNGSTGNSWLQGGRTDTLTNAYSISLNPAGGNVGIGTTNPLAPLNVSAADASVIGLVSGTTNGIRFGTSATAGIIEGVDKTGIGSYQQLQVGGSVVALTISGSEKARVDSTGNFGIGTTTPGSILAVQGVANFTTATSTFSSTGGLNITNGCYAVNGVCVGSGGAAAAGTLTGTTLASNVVNSSLTSVGTLGSLTVSGTATVGNLINNGVTASTLLYANASKQESSVSLPSYVTLTSGTLGISQLPIAQGGTNATSFATTGNDIYWNGTSLATAPLTSAVTIPYASSTVLSTTGSAYFATGGASNASVGIGTTSPYAVLSIDSSGTNNNLFSIGSVAGTAQFSVLKAAGTATTTVYLTNYTASSWTVPADWNSSMNSIEVIGAGGAGGTTASSYPGGGGGAYSKSVNVTLTPNTTVTYAVGSGFGVNDSYICNSTSNCASISGTAVIVGAKGGGVASGSTPGTGGAAASGVGSVKYSGGNGSTSSSGGAGGGAAGPSGVGGNASGTTGGTGDNGKVAGSSSTGVAGKTGTEWGSSYGVGSGGSGDGYGGTAGGGGGGGALNGEGGSGLIVIQYQSTSVISLGVGTSNPGSALDVVGPSGNYANTESATSNAFQIETGKNAGDQILYMGNDKVNNDSYIQAVDYGTTVDSLALNARGGNVGVGTSTPVSTLTVDGSFCVDQVTSATLKCGTTNGNIYYKTANTGAYDVAENYLASNAAATVPGTIVALDTANGGESITTAMASSTVLGVVSTDPGMVLGGADSATAGTLQAPVALSGRVPVSVDMEGGPIAIGDRIALSSTPGVGMKATQSGETIGIALQAFTGTSSSTPSTGKIDVFVQPQYWFAPANLSLNAGTDGTATTTETTIGAADGTTTNQGDLTVDGDISGANITGTGQGVFGGSVAAPSFIASGAVSGLTLTATNSVIAAGYIVPGVGQSLQSQYGALSFASAGGAAGTGSTTIASALTADGTGADLYKLATFTLSGVQALTATTDALTLQQSALASTTNSVVSQVASLSARVSALEAGAAAATATLNASSTSSSDLLATTTSVLAGALNNFGILIQQGVAQFDTLVVRDLVFSKDSSGQSAAGSGTVLAGNTTVEIDNAHMLASSQVSVTLTSPMTGNWYVTDKKDGSFRVTLSGAQGSDVTFDYLIIQTQGQIATSTSDSLGADGSANPFSWLVHFLGGTSSSTAAPATVPDTNNGTTGASETGTGSSTGTAAGATASSTPNPLAPVVTLTGGAVISVDQNGVFLDPGATAKDANGTDISSSIVETGSVDVTTPGMYTLTYTATDAAGNTGNVSRVVSVVATGASDSATPAPITGTTSSAGGSSSGSTSGTGTDSSGSGTGSASGGGSASGSSSTATPATSSGSTSDGSTSSSGASGTGGASASGAAAAPSAPASTGSSASGASASASTGGASASSSAAPASSASAADSSSSSASASSAPASAAAPSAPAAPAAATSASS